ncbi:Chromatin modification-related protein [Fulvia fulva]|uniref:Chromatin modification-related protein n=1 Tax=Passalora fulva TaxID=5499 RepID=A0A9Q8LGN2_PASFU|nr:Chromatin modification-related protein [Fulvia fulva]UJO16283.1 Chromatin modification-related protein [Fulvia fulva]WPV29248.1 Chromatin modification-related protein [Fulvia fulva]
MSLANPEDAASVLEQFTHDIANIPAEITHLMEEIHAKDLTIAAFRDEINKRDNQLQKWVRLNGGHVQNPKEEPFSKTINDYYDKCEILQAEKCGLSEKAMIVLDRQIKRLDVGLRGLAQTEQFPSDWPGPSLLTGSGTTTGVNTPAAVTSQATPLQVVSGNIGSTGGAPNIANAAQMRLAQNAAGGGARAVASAQTPVTLPRGQREGSSEANKRRKLNASLGNLPTASSGLRQSSLGPGTPKAGTPGPGLAASSRAGSAQPAVPAGNKKAQPAPSKRAPPQARKRTRPSGATKKSDRRRQLARDRATPSTNASVSDSDDESASPTPSSIIRSQNDGSGEALLEEEDDETIYCYCKKVSFGDMVGCDNDNCPYQWFHYKCVGVSEEPTGEWLCPTCRVLPRNKLKIEKN